ncbi:hypothetical protein CPB86DRAFT_789595 [Serendipita vermifera]|nr:hypothetical protein CPB86DRAFT_789595 [Serendipita vermifera]
MTSVDFYAPTPRRTTSKSNLRTAVQATVQFTRPSKRTADVPTAPAPSAPSITYQASSSKVDLSAEDPHVRASSRSLKRAFRSPFSKSIPSSPERPAVPELPAELRENVAAIKQSSKSSSKKTKKESEVRMHAKDTKNYRPVNYNQAVQLSMLLEGGTQEYWINKARQTGEDDEGVNVAEVGGFKDDDGNIWWDMEEKAEWTSLLPKDAQGEAVHNQSTWVEFTDYRRGSTSSDHSTLSSISAELAEGVDGPLFYGDAESEQAPAAAMYGIQKPTTGTVLFPVDMNEDWMSSSDAAAARAIIRQANGHLSKKQGVFLSDGFEDHFVSLEIEDRHRPRVELSFEQQQAAAPAAKPTKKGGFMKILRGNKHATRQ